MTNLAISIFIMIAIAAVIVVISLIAYNRRLDRIARGEIHGAHNAIPEPGTTAGITYKVMLMALMILAVLNISAVSGIVLPMQSSISSLRTTNDRLINEVSELHQEIASQNKKTYYASWEPQSYDMQSKTAVIKLYASLKEYSKDTEVSVFINGGSIPMTLDDSGEFSTLYTAGLFDEYRDAKLLINDGGRISSEPFDFSGELFLEYLPMPTAQCTFNSDYRMGKLSYSGSFSISPATHPEKVESATLTYMTGGRELKSFDITENYKTGSEITLEKGLELEKDLTFKTEVSTTDGFKITQTSVMIYAADGSEYKDGLTICDKNGTVVWEEIN